MTCETCSATFSRKKCLHEKCISHQEEFAEFKRKVDNHIRTIVIRAWYSRDNALEVQTPEIDNTNIVVSHRNTMIQSLSAKTSGFPHPPKKNEAAGVTPTRPRNQTTFLTPAATPIGQGAFKTVHRNCYHTNTTTLTSTDYNNEVIL